MTAILLAAVLAKAPDFTLRALDGRTIRLSDYRGKVVLLNFWATWCNGCRVEIPRLVAEYRQHRSGGLEIIGVSMDDGDGAMIGSFAKLKGVNYTVVKGNDAVAKSYGGVRFLPQTFVIGRDGAIVERIAGVPEPGEFGKMIERVLRAAVPLSRLQHHLPLSRHSCHRSDCYDPASEAAHEQNHSWRNPRQHRAFRVERHCALAADRNGRRTDCRVCERAGCPEGDRRVDDGARALHAARTRHAPAAHGRRETELVLEI